MRDKLLALERLLWQSKAEVYRAHIMEDAVIFMNGESAITRDNVIERVNRWEVDGQRWANVELDEMEFLALDNNAAIITYRARGSVRGKNSELFARCTSLYMRRNGALRLAFHEQMKASKP
ncbi:MAG: DUF4440 domain-containing protein [Mesorhizobium sp.]